MPAKNIIKIYVEDGYYHVYNRGVEKRIIFKDDQDYKVFLDYLKIYLQPPQPLLTRTESIGDTVFTAPRRPLNNFHNEIELIAYCLMPNHFHLLLKQRSQRALESFMRSLLTKYSTYFNKRYKRVGSLFQSTYKAALVDNDNYLLHLSRYIHLNPVKGTPLHILHMAYSSYGDYIGKRDTKWIKKENILSFFNDTKKTGLVNLLSYQSFVEKYSSDSKETLGRLTLEDDEEDL
ncbi:MAG: transposase [Candidatus Levyibacteriota bacterium]